ncbi:MAG: SCP2 sterol-binding domain-containing protein [Micavibrio sp.]
MSLDELAEKMQSRLDGFGHVVKLDFDDDGILHIDATQSPPVVSKDDSDSDVTLKTSLETFEKIVKGEQDPNIAFMMGKLKVSGSMGLALKLNSLLED